MHCLAIGINLVFFFHLALITTLKWLTFDSCQLSVTHIFSATRNLMKNINFYIPNTVSRGTRTMLFCFFPSIVASRIYRQDLHHPMTKFKSHCCRTILPLQTLFAIFFFLTKNPLCYSLNKILTLYYR